MGLKSDGALRRRDDGLGERGAPSPPRSNASFSSAAIAPPSSARRLTASTSSSVSPGKRLIATTAFSPNSFTIPRWRCMLAAPRSIASTPPSGSSPWCLSARGGHEDDGVRRSPPTRQTMSKNFSMPMSEPKPDSVTV